jgi:hypothetical protein
MEKTRQNQDIFEAKYCQNAKMGKNNTRPNDARSQVSNVNN